MSEKFKPQSAEHAVEKTIEEFAKRAYRAVGAEKEIDPDAVYYSGVCEQVSAVFYRELVARYGEGNVELMRYDVPGVAVHEFCRVRIGSEYLIIDPTWQQFLTDHDSSKPRVLCVPEQNLEKILEESGISEVKRMIWRDAKRKHQTESAA